MPRHLIAPLCALALVAAFPLSGATFYVELTTKIMIMAIFALSLDLLVGFVETFGTVFFPQAAGVLVYVLMAAILLWRPEGLFRTA